MNPSNTNPKKKYSGLFVENDGLNCFTENIPLKTENQTTASSNTQQPKQNATANDSNPSEGPAKDSNSASTYNTNTNSFNTNNYYNMYNGYPNSIFPMVNIPMMNMMSFQNMMYMGDNSGKGMYDNSYNELMGMSIEQILEQFDEKIKDQQGCKELQGRLESEKNGSPFFTQIFEKIISNFKEYSNDQYANYLCQKVVELSDNAQLSRIIKILAQDIINMSNSSHGTRVVQKVVENVEKDELIELILQEFKGNVVGIVLDSNGNHVIQKCLSYFVAEKLEFMYQEIMSKCEVVATHKHGCCVLQRCIDYCNDEQIKSVVSGILTHTDVLINDKYGNYVIQYILELQGYEEDKQEIASTVASKLEFYCYEKFSSNVIEKAIKVDMQVVLDKLLKVLESPEELKKMLCHKYANYVIQTTLLRNRGSPKIQKALNNIKLITKDIMLSEFGSKVFAKLQRVFDFESNSNVKQKDSHDRDYKRKGGKGGKYPNKKKGNYRQNNHQSNNNGLNNGKNGGNNHGQNQNQFNTQYNASLYPTLEQSASQGFVNMNMNLNFNVNLNYQNQQANASNVAGSQ